MRDGLGEGLALLALLAAGAMQLAHADDWPQWRGPDRNGISKESGWLDHWPDEGPKITWKATVGLGFSSFVTKADRVYTMGHGQDVDTVFCLDTGSGKEIWKHSYPAELGDKYFPGGTTGSPTLDGNRLYTLSRWGDLFCFEAANGKILWSKNIQKETGIRIPDWGFTGAPFVYKNLLVLNIGDAGMGVDKNTGNVVWKSANKNAGYSTPLPFSQGTEPLVVIGSGQSYVAVNPENGKEAWRVRWMTEYGVNGADPLISGEKILISTGYGKGAGLFELAQNPPKEIWKSKVLRTQLSPGVIKDGFVYGMDGDTDDDGPLKCIELQTGKERWSEPKMGTGGLLIADGKFIVLSSHGELSVAPVSPDAFKPTARAQVLGGKCWTAPVLSNGRVYCRNSRGDIACVDLRGGK
ncbi:MAG TPA: PQQ-binding-like beta-propeller repeat protein [Verrucomicrobiae bacterium]|jgi:outer membrane protein assembly factor BamB|nr:PQQ-binding-like beta-propeller repeat protein [Verrucomicrobiae bacterium]